jgi:hypothetical protein
MSDEPQVPAGLTVHQARIYYEPWSGDVVHLHQLVAAPTDELDSDRIQVEMNAFEQGLRQRHGDVEYLIIEPKDVSALAEGVRVDVERRTLVRRDPSS